MKRSDASRWLKSVGRFVGMCIAALVTLFPAACSTPSLSRAYTDQTLERVPGIEGEWIQTPKPGEEPRFSLVITQREGTLYKVDINVLKTSDEPAAPGPQRLTVGMTKINGQLFADATADYEREPVLKQYQDYIIPAHVFALVAFDGTTLDISPLSGGGLDTMLKERPDTIGHSRGDSGVVITAETGRVREFLGAQGGNHSLFPAEPVVRFARVAAK